MGAVVFGVKMKAAQIFVFLLMAMMMMVRTKPHCPGGWSLFFRDKICYKFFRGLRTYEEARSLCKEQGGSSAEVAVASNNERNNIISFHFTDQNVWIGGKRWPNRYSKTFRWDDGQSWSYANWYPGEPNGPGREVCLVTNWPNDGKGRWNDWRCSQKALTVCQVPPH